MKTLIVLIGMILVSCGKWELGNGEENQKPIPNSQLPIPKLKTNN